MCNRLCWYFSFVHSGETRQVVKMKSFMYWSNKWICSPCPIWEYPLDWKWALGSILDCVCVCVSAGSDCLSSDPHISPADLKDGKAILNFYRSFLRQPFPLFCSSVKLSSLAVLHPFLVISPTISPCTIPISSCQVPSFFHFLSFNNVMFLFLSPHLSVFYFAKTHLAAIFFSVMKRFSSSLESPSLPFFFFSSREARLISFRVMSENVPLFRHLGDNYEICWTNEHPHSQRCSKSNLIPCRVEQLRVSFDVYGPTCEGTTQVELKLMLDRLSQTFSLLTLILRCHLWSLSQLSTIFFTFHGAVSWLIF